MKTFRSDTKQEEDEFSDGADSILFQNSSKPQFNITSFYEAFTLSHICGDSKTTTSTIQRDTTFIKDRNNKTIYSIVVHFIKNNANFKGIVFH